MKERVEYPNIGRKNKLFPIHFAIFYFYTIETMPYVINI